MGLIFNLNKDFELKDKMRRLWFKLSKKYGIKVFQEILSFRMFQSEVLACKTF